jgi:hypothetical protein
LDKEEFESLIEEECDDRLETDEEDEEECPKDQGPNLIVATRSGIEEEVHEKDEDRTKAIQAPVISPEEHQKKLKRERKSSRNSCLWRKPTLPGKWTRNHDGRSRLGRSWR